MNSRKDYKSFYAVRKLKALKSSFYEFQRTNWYWQHQKNAGLTTSTCLGIYSPISTNVITSLWEVSTVFTRTASIESKLLLVKYGADYKRRVLRKLSEADIFHSKNRDQVCRIALS